MRAEKQRHPSDSLLPFLANLNYPHTLEQGCGDESVPKPDACKVLNLFSITFSSDLNYYVSLFRDFGRDRARLDRLAR